MRQTRATAVLGLGAAAVLTLTACGGSNNASSTDGESGSVRIDGSSTVYPLTAVAAEDFQVANPGVRVTVGSSGTGGGFEKFCRGETDANDASRPIKDDEVANCEANGIDFASLTMAIDALTVVVNKDNDWATCLTTDQLAQIWSPESTVTNWNQVDPAFPDEPVALFGPGTDSGTFDYFTEEINGESGASRTDYTPSEDDNVIVQGVSGSKGGLGYFGYTYFEENADSLKALSIDSGAGCVAPSVETARDGSYTPLARPLFVYVSGPALQRPEVGNFFQYFVDNNVSIAESALYIPLSEEGQAQLVDDFAALESMGGAE
ncbi:MAG: PstS family phosphate ABC transporter substrate-binding protein [Candidatus Nanopelagicales bacterium]|nr:PstS family phosphate ABC transporter substrate-binding protein [Candidatus Nanopelagicales bacterium]